MNSSFSVVLFVVPLALCGIAGMVFGRWVGFISLAVVLAGMAFNIRHFRQRNR